MHSQMHTDEHRPSVHVSEVVERVGEAAQRIRAHTVSYKRAQNELQAS